MHNYTRKIERKQQLVESKLGVKMAYFLISGIFEANSGCKSHTKSGKLLIERNSCENSRSLCNISWGSQIGILKKQFRDGPIAQWQSASLLSWALRAPLLPNLRFLFWWAFSKKFELILNNGRRDECGRSLAAPSSLGLRPCKYFKKSARTFRWKRKKEKRKNY